MGTTNTKASKKKTNKMLWKVFAYVLLMLQIVLSAVAVIKMTKSQLFPIGYVILFLVLLWGLLFLEFALMVVLRKKKGQKKSTFYFKRGLGTTLAVLVCAICMLVSSLVGKIDTTLENVVVDSDVVVTDTVSVYVPIATPADKIEDLKDGTFGITKGYDYDNSLATVTDINEKLGKEVSVQEFDAPFEMIDAMNAGEIDAIILNVTYEEIIVETEGYETFILDTKVVYQHYVESVVEKSEAVAKDVSNDIFMAYISGSDTRSSKLAKSRSDVNILAIVNPTKHQVLLVNTPRDYYVPISISNGTCDKLTHCGLYGYECSMDTLGNLYDCKVDYYMQMNFEGFITLIDAIGGITVESDKKFVTTHYDKQIYEGLNDMDGQTALGFARERYAFSDGDNARGRNSMKIIKAIIEKMSSGTTLLSNYGDILDSMEGMFATNMPTEAIQELVRMQLADMKGWDVRSYAVTGTGDSRTTYSVPNAHAYVMIPDQASVDKAVELINKIEAGELLTDADFE